jgi:hypothetical protein
VLQGVHQFLELFARGCRAVDLDVDGDALGSLADGVVDAGESGEVNVEAEVVSWICSSLMCRAAAREARVSM